MAILGSTSKPTGFQEWFGQSSSNQHAQLFTMPAGGPWRITDVGVWAAGKDGSVSAKVCLWSPTAGAILRESAAFTLASMPFALGNSALYERALTSTKDITGGTQIYAGWARSADGAGESAQHSYNSGGTHVDDNYRNPIPSGISTGATHSGTLGIYIVYEAANSLPNAPTIVEPDQNEVVDDTTPLIDWTYSDPDGGSQTGFQMQVDNSSGFTSPVFDSGDVTSATTSDTCSTTLTRGTTYYTRVKTRDAVGFGPWSSTRTFSIKNNLPLAPTIDSPTQNQVVTSTTPLIDWTHSDPDGSTQTGYQVQVDNNSDFSSPTWDSGSVTSSTTSATPSALSRGVTYYARVRTRDHVGFGPYSSTRTFKIAATPVGTVTTPSGSVAAPLYYTAGTDTTPKLKPVWTFSCADGGTQASASVKVYDAAGTTLLHTHAHTGTAVTASISGYAVTNGTKYQIAVIVTCSHAVPSAESAKKSCQVRWARASYRGDLGSVPLTLTTATSTTTNSGEVIMEYGTSAASTPEPTDWKATISEATKLQWAWHRVTLLPAATASPTSPALNSVTFSYSANVSVPDDWTVAAGSTLDEGSYVYGTLSLKHTTNAAEQLTYQEVEVVPGTDYIFSARIKTQGEPAAALQLRESGTATVLVEVAAPADNGDFVRYVTPVWNSGAATAVRVVMKTNAAVGPDAWFDALKLEASLVVTPWTPGFLGQAVVLDAGGISVDAQKGGVFRLRSAVGDNVIELDDGGLRMSGTGDASLASTAHGLQIGPTSGVNLIADNNEIMSRNNGAASALYLNTDGGNVTVSDDAATVFVPGIRAYGRINYRSTTLSVATSTTTQVAAFTSTFWNGGGVGTSVDLFTVDITGIYLVNLRASFAANATGSRGVGVGIDGVGPSGYNWLITGAGTIQWRGSGVWVLHLNAGQVLRPYVYQTSGASLTMEGGTVWSCTRLGRQA